MLRSQACWQVLRCVCFLLISLSAAAFIAASTAAAAVACSSGLLASFLLCQVFGRMDGSIDRSFGSRPDLCVESFAGHTAEDFLVRFYLVSSQPSACLMKHARCTIGEVDSCKCPFVDRQTKDADTLRQRQMETVRVCGFRMLPFRCSSFLPRTEKERKPQTVTRKKAFPRQRRWGEGGRRFPPHGYNVIYCLCDFFFLVRETMFTCVCACAFSIVQARFLHDRIGRKRSESFGTRTCRGVVGGGEALCEARTRINSRRFWDGTNSVTRFSVAISFPIVSDDNVK